MIPTRRRYFAGGARVDDDAIRAAIERFDGNLSAAARHLGVAQHALSADGTAVLSGVSRAVQVRGRSRLASLLRHRKRGFSYHGRSRFASLTAHRSGMVFVERRSRDLSLIRDGGGSSGVRAGCRSEPVARAHPAYTLRSGPGS